ncbi:MAG: type II toxin-antitoxin system RelE/ParE family toxin [Pseudomonadota bacterium]
MQSDWVIRYSDNVVEKDIPILSSSIKQRIAKTIEIKLKINPIHFGKPLRYSLSNLRSLRIGDYRVLYQLDNENKIVSIV